MGTAILERWRHDAVLRWFGADDPTFARRLRFGVVAVALWLSFEVDLRYADLPKGATVSALGLLLPAAAWSSTILLWATKGALWGGAALWLARVAPRRAAWLTVAGMLLLGSIYWENLPWFRHKFVCPLWILVALAAAEHRVPWPPRWLRECATLTLASFYGGAGIAKLVGSGVAWADGVGLQLWLLRLGDRDSLIRAWVIDDATIAALLASGALLLELAALLMVPFPRLRRPLGVALLALHFGIDQILHIDFRPQMVLVALVLVLPASRRVARDNDQARQSTYSAVEARS
jgi:hypothetical protein